MNLNARLPYLAVLIIYCFYFIFQAMPQWQNILQNQLIDSDDVARLLEVKAWLNGQGFYDLSIHRANPPYGAPMHWSRLGDIPLAGMILFLRLFTNQEMAQNLAVFLTPLILGLIIAWLIAISAYKLSAQKLAPFISFAIFFICDAANLSFLSGRVDHHGLQSIFLIAMILGFICGKNGGLISGFAIGLSLTIGFELLPLQLIFMVYVTLYWAILGDKIKTYQKSLAIGLAAAIIFGFLINNAPKDYLLGQNDKLSIAQTAPILIGALGLYLSAQFLSLKNIFIRISGLALSAIAALALALQFPALLKPLYWQVTPLFRQLWLADVGETMPMMVFPIDIQVTSGLFLFMALFAALINCYFVLKSKDEDKIRGWLTISIMLGFATILAYCFQSRVIIHSASLAVIVAGAIIAQIWGNFGIIKGLIALILLYPNFGENIGAYLAHLRPKNSQLTYGEAIKCHAKNDFAHLANLPKGLVLSNINSGIETLMNTPHDVVTAHFHRDEGRVLAYDIFIGNNENAMDKIRKNNIKYIAYCTRMPEIIRISQYAPNGFLANLINDKAPANIIKINSQKPSDMIVFQIK